MVDNKQTTTIMVDNKTNYNNNGRQ
jgi:hypothetical protein